MPAPWSEHKNWRALFFGSCALFATALLIDVGGLIAYMPVPDPSAPALPQQLRGICSDGLVPGALIIAAWLALRRPESLTRNVTLALAALACAMLFPLGWGSWTQSHYTPALAARFAPWRAAIPRHAEVLWPDTPIGAWYLLERPSYLSAHQTAGAIFSREKALLVEHRVESISAALAAGGISTNPRQPHSGAQPVPLEMFKLNRAAMAAACADPDLSYVVSWTHVAPTPFAPIVLDPTKSNGKVYLYRCADFRT
jgi:hypothetical protein